MNILSRLKLRTKLILLLGLCAVAVIASIALAASQMRQRMLADRVATLRAATQMSIGLAELLEKQVAAGQLTRPAAVAKLADSLHVMKFDGGNGYVMCSIREKALC